MKISNLIIRLLYNYLPNYSKSLIQILVCSFTSSVGPYIYVLLNCGTIKWNIMKNMNFSYSSYWYIYLNI
jgi:hypothetical protein